MKAKLRGLFRAISVPERVLSGGVWQDPSAPYVRFSMAMKAKLRGLFRAISVPERVLSGGVEQHPSVPHSRN
jgi:hypothetical protein